MDVCLIAAAVFLVGMVGVWLHRKIEASADWEDWECEDDEQGGA